jgi:hypothetical protein
MTSAGFPAAEATGEGEYARFGKRNLDRMSWLAPLVNNRLGDRLNLELRHEQLFLSRAIGSSKISATASKDSDYGGRVWQADPFP